MAECDENSGFDRAWRAVARNRNLEGVSGELRPLLQRVYGILLGDPIDLAALKRSLTLLLEFLSGPGRTNANCWATDKFFGTDAWWERSWTDQNLPEEFHDVLAMMGEALHDTVGHPEIAENFDCLPEELLERVRNLKV